MTTDLQNSCSRSACLVARKRLFLASTALMAMLSHGAMAASVDEVIDDGDVRDVNTTTSYTGELIVGSGGTGTLNIKDGGKVTNAGEGTVGYQAGSNGTVTVDGSGSSWVNGPGRELSIGWSGTGALTITDGGSVSNSNGFIGARAGGSGTVTVRDAGSIWTNSSQLILGFGASAGTLSIENGGTVINKDGRIGLSSGGTGVVTVTGANSTLTDNGSTLRVGYEGNGTLNISDGGLVTVGAETNGMYDGTLSIASKAGSTGTLNIGAGAGQSAAAPGTLKAANLAFGEGDGTLVFNHTASDYLFAAAIAGDGVIDALAGTTTLTGDASRFTGSAVIASGAGLLMGADANFGGSITNNSALTFADNDDFTFAKTISGTGTLTKMGTGTLNLTGDSSSFSGATTLADGRLNVNGSLAGSVVTTQSGSILSGSGTVGGIVAQAGSTISPGNSPGTLTVNGNYVAQPGSAYAVELVPGTTTSDKIVVNGTATIQNGATLQATSYGTGSFLPNSRYTVLTATGGVTGTYTLNDTLISAFYGIRDNYDANNVYLDVAQIRSFTDAALTRNQYGAGSGLQSLPVGNGLRGIIETMPDDATARAAFDQSSGEIHASAMTVLIEDGRFVREATGDHIRGAFGGVGKPQQVITYEPGIDLNDRTPRAVIVDAEEAQGLALWTRGFGSWGQFDGDGNAADMERDIGGLFVGADVAVSENMRLGVVGGHSQSSFSVDDLNSSGTSDNFDLGVYGGGQWDKLGASFGISYTWHDVSTDRSVAFRGFSDKLSADYDAQSFQIYGDVGYTIDVGEASFEPFVGLEYVNLNTDGFTESGGAAALTGFGNEIDTTFSTIGLRVSQDFNFGEVPLTASGMVGWSHAFSDETPTSRHQFDGSSPFTISGVPLPEDVAVFEAGLNTAINDALSIGVSYSGKVGDGVSDHGGRGNLSWAF
ncbi:autotransporter domain-containing protein [Fulvimarina sp. MAC8]|uniref:autotransporter outer membrane beta-barrel domain-containing protein n=1 Tax=Fulvimarina sp. MAC8 TaxID=3162874 RepID=UPI0032EF7BE2